MTYPLFTLGYVTLGAVSASALSRFGATLSVRWTGGDAGRLTEARKWSTGFALVGGALAACSPVHPLLALFLAASTGLFTSFCLGVWFLGEKIPHFYGQLLGAVDGSADRANALLSQTETRKTVAGAVRGAFSSVKGQLKGLGKNVAVPAGAEDVSEETAQLAAQATVFGEADMEVCELAPDTDPGRHFVRRRRGGANR
ncbi:MAG: hypothetical protein SFV17_10335 [Candidatus Obscuribacter sp.]|nr:hypothetical protein [Candidatus Obscuribacter sp.]